jgi:Glycosyl transferase family 2
MSTLLSGVRVQWDRVRAARADLRAARARAEQLVGMTSELGVAIQACRDEIAAAAQRVEALEARTANQHARALHAMRIVRDDDARSWERLWAVRAGNEYAAAFDDDEPLVTIVVSTYNRFALLRERALPSVLSQTYEHYECIVVGDGADPEAAEVVNSFQDSRLRFVNLPYRGPYPTNPSDAWLVGGTTPFNTALALAAGRWIGAVNDDDSLRPRYIESLLELARRERSEVVYGKLQLHDPASSGRLLGRFPPEQGQWGLQSSLVHSGLRYLPLHSTDWLFEIPHDWSLAERMLRIGVRFAMLDEIVTDYYPSLLWTDRPAIR